MFCVCRRQIDQIICVSLHLYVYKVIFSNIILFERIALMLKLHYLIFNVLFFGFRLARGELASRLSLVSPKFFFPPFCHRGSFSSLPLSPLACSVGDTSFLVIIVDLIAQILFKLN